MIDKSLRQYYQDGENVGPFEKGRKLVSTQKRKSAEEWKGLASEFILNRHRITTQDIKDVKEGTSSIPKVVKRILKRYVGMGEQEKAQGLNLSDNKITSVLRAAKTGKGALDFFSGSQSLLKFFAPAAVVGGVAYLHKNRERFTGYPTQVAYEQARDLRILETRRADMLQRKEEGKSYSDTNLGQVTREIAEKKGLDINNPNEMKNIDKDIEDTEIEKILLDEPSFIGEGYDITEPLGIEEMMWQEVSEGRDRPGPSGQTVAETAAMEDIAPAPPAPPTPVTYYAPSPEQHGGGGDRHGGGGGYGRGRDPGGGAAGSPFKKGGRIDKPLTGRSRDI